jgi:hypothetical protein
MWSVEGDRRRAADIEQLNYRALLLWSAAINDELAHFRAVVALGRAERAGLCRSFASRSRVMADSPDPLEQAGALAYDPTGLTRISRPRSGSRQGSRGGSIGRGHR